METIKDKTFYSVHGWEDTKSIATFSKYGYIKKGNAQKVAINLIKKGFKQVILRCENVWFRNDDNEFSESTPIEIYTQNGMELLKKSTYTVATD